MTSAQDLQEYFALLKHRPLEHSESAMLEIIQDPQFLENYSKQHHVKLGIIYRSSKHIFVVDLVKDKSGNIFPYERLLKTATGSSVVVVPFYNGNIILLKQFRHALGEFQYCFPRGFAEEGISPSENATKELQEELNCSVGQPTLLGQVVADSGLCGEKVWVFRCDIDDPKTDGFYENIASYKEVSFNTLIQLVRSGQINDGFTLSAIALLQSTQ